MFLAGEGEVVITAGTASQVVAENIELGQGLFTYHLVDGFRGKADTNGDGLVTVTELFTYIQNELRRASESTGLRQTPAMHASGLTDFVLSIAD